MKPGRWQPCVDHRPSEVRTFVSDYFGGRSDPCLVISGAGFDPRSGVVTDLLRSASNILHGIFIKEERPNPDVDLIERAKFSLATMARGLASATVISVDVFAADGAVVGGRTLLSRLEAELLEGYKDIVIDLSALSIGISFPLVKYLLHRTDPAHTNVHLFAASNPELDNVIQSQPGDRASVVHGFRRVNEYYGAVEHARLWLPQLAMGRQPILRRIYDEVRPHDTCPILPFPAADPKAGDRLAAAYLTELEDTWSVDTSSLIFAHEDDPLDLYRKILRIEEDRKPVFQQFGGSTLVLSPLGSRMLSIGALMAALDRDLPVYYVEARGYEVDWTRVDKLVTTEPLIRHVWLSGDVYPLVQQPEDVPKGDERAAATAADPA